MLDLIFYRKDEAYFKSESVTTLSDLKQYISKEATSRNVKISINLSIKDDTVMDVLNGLHPKVDYQLTLAKRVKLLEALSVCRRFLFIFRN